MIGMIYLSLQDLAQILLHAAIGHVNEYPALHYFWNPRHTQPMIAYIIMTEYFWKFQWKIAWSEWCKHSPICLLSQLLFVWQAESFEGSLSNFHPLNIQTGWGNYLMNHPLPSNNPKKDSDSIICGVKGHITVSDFRYLQIIFLLVYHK